MSNNNNNEKIVISAELSEEELEQIAGGVAITLNFPTKDGKVDKKDLPPIKGSLGNWKIELP
jgi:bacteriocin-like protein